MLGWLLILVPAALAVHWLMPEAHSLVFGSAALAIIPLAGWMGRATEALAVRAGEGVGGLLNATFGNAAELVIALAVLRHGLYDVVKASIAGSIVGNILLVMGAAILAGGLRFRSQHYNVTAARSQATMLLIAAISQSRRRPGTDGQQYATGADLVCLAVGVDSRADRRRRGVQLAQRCGSARRLHHFGPRLFGPPCHSLIGATSEEGSDYVHSGNNFEKRKDVGNRSCGCDSRNGKHIGCSCR
jgi:sodium/calcium exchanger protein